MQENQIKQVVLSQISIETFSDEEQALYEHLMPQAQVRATAFTAQIMGIIAEHPQPWDMVESVLQDILRDKYYSELLQAKRLQAALVSEVML